MYVLHKYTCIYMTYTLHVYIYKSFLHDASTCVTLRNLYNIIGSYPSKIIMGRKPNKEIMLSIVGIDEPTRRPNDINPLTGRPDNARSRVGDRRRIEDMEFKLGYVICGRRMKNGDYCTSVPDKDTGRCKRHQSHVEAGRATISPGVYHSITSNEFLRCRACKDVSCEHHTDDKRSDVCFYETELYDELMTDKSRVVEAGVIASTTFDSLVMDTIILHRLYRKMALDGMMVEELKGYTPFDGSLVPTVNKVEHPLLKHISKLQQSATQLANALELTPKSQTQKDDTSNENDFRATLKNMYAESIKANMEKKQ